MSVRRAQAGVSTVLVIVVMLLLLVGTVASYTLTRLSSGFDERTRTIARLQRAAEGIDAYVASARRLPCPANPASADGVEEPALGVTCTFPAGTLPWKTIGVRREEAFDEWGFKISYRVYHGAEGLTQPGGMDMSHCDTVEGVPAGLAAGKLCTATANAYAHNQRASDFLAGKGLRLVDMGSDLTNRAYVLISHGETAMGAFGVNGIQTTLPAGDERSNATGGPYTIKAFSDPDTAATAGTHFDDLLAYRTIEDLARRAGLAARDWPEGARFDDATATAVLGGTGPHTGRNSFTYMGNTFRAVGNDEFSYSSIDGTTGIGVSDDAGTDWAITLDEFIQIDFAQAASKMAITLAGFGNLDIGFILREQVNFRFFNGSSPVGGTVLRQGCGPDGRHTLVVQPSRVGETFTRVEVQPDWYTPFIFLSSAFLISEVAACGPGVPCTTSLATAGNTCAVPSVAAAFSPATVTLGTNAALVFTITNVADALRFEGMGLKVALPAGLILSNPVVFSTTCAAAAVADVAADRKTFSVTPITIAAGAASCQIQAAISPQAIGIHRQTTTTSNLTQATVESELTVQAP